MELQTRFEAHVNQENLFHKEDLLIIAVSGGVDSMVLTELCRQAQYNIVLAHCNFRLRGEESSRDQQFVKQYAEKNDIPFHTVSFDTLDYISLHKVSVQEGARQLRYGWLNELAEKLALDKNQRPLILTAHHADDQIETLLMHFCRGTGLKGLTGIPAKHDKIVRPLLIFSKKELTDYAAVHHVRFVTDRSNEQSFYTRNYFRNEIIPALEKIYPSVKENLLDNIRRLTATEALYKTTLAPLLKKLIIHKGDELHIPVQRLLQYRNTSLIYECIHPYGFTEAQVQEVIKLSSAQSGSYIIAPGTGYRMIRHGRYFIIAQRVANDTAFLNIDDTLSAVHYRNGVITLEKDCEVPRNVISDRQIALLDANAIQFPLLLRRWKEGDYFYPLGMRKKKKIARFLIDQKLSATEKEKIWVLESNQRIIWVVGQRMDDRFKITSSTNKVLKIENRMRDLPDETTK